MAGPIPGILAAARSPLVNTQRLEEEKSFRSRQVRDARESQQTTAPRALGQLLGTAMKNKFGKPSDREKLAERVTKAEGRARSVYKSTPDELRDRTPWGEQIQKAGILVQELEAADMPNQANKIREQILAMHTKRQEYAKGEGDNAKLSEEVKQARITTAARKLDRDAADKEIRWLNELEEVDTSTPEGKARFVRLTALLDKAQAITGRTEFDQGPDKVTRRKVSDSLIETTGILDGFQDMAKAFKPEYLQFGSRFKNWSANLLEIAGLGLDDETTKVLEEFTVFRQITSKNTNAYIKFITGAQMNKDEVPRLMKDVPNLLNDGPTKFLSKMNKMNVNYGALRARSLHAIAAGTDEEFHRIMATPFEQYMDKADDIADQPDQKAMALEIVARVRAQIEAQRQSQVPQ